METFLTVLFIIIVIVIEGFVAFKFEEIAKMKGHKEYFWWCFWLGPVGWMMVIALPDRNGSWSKEQSEDSLPEL